MISKAAKKLDEYKIQIACLGSGLNLRHYDYTEYGWRIWIERWGEPRLVQIGVRRLRGLSINRVRELLQGEE